MFVQFLDSSHAVVISIFSCRQDEEAWPNQGAVAASDDRYRAYYESLPEIARLGLPVPI